MTSPTNSKPGRAEKREARQDRREERKENREGRRAEKPPGNFIQRWVGRKIINSIIKKIDNMKGSWKTSLAGWLALIASLAVAGIALIDGDPATKPNAQAIFEALQALGIGIPLWLIGLFARDNKVTSKEAGAE